MDGEDFGEVDAKRDVFQADGLSPPLFFLKMVPLLLILKKINANYEWGEEEYKLNHLLFMDDLKLFSKSKELMDTPVRTAHVFSSNIGMEFGIKKCGVLTKLANSELMNTWTE